MTKTVEVMIGVDEKYPDYTLSLRKQFKSFCDYAIKTDGITNLPISLYNKFMQAQKKYTDVENELDTWLEKHPEATRYTRDKKGAC